MFTLENRKNRISLFYNFVLREQSFSESFMLVVVVREIDMEGALSQINMYIYWDQHLSTGARQLQ